MTEAEIYQGLGEVFREVFGDAAPPLRAELSAEDVPGWDSVKMVNIILAVEQHFSVRLRSREVDKLRNVGDLATLVQSKQAG